MKIFLFLLLVLGTINDAFAGCSYEGTDYYPTGSIVNGYTYHEDGTWIDG